MCSVMSHRVGDDLAELQRGAAGRIFFEAVMALDDLDVDARRQILAAPWPAISVSFIATLTAVLMLGDQTIGICLRRLAMYSCWSASRPVVAIDQRPLELDAVRDDGDGRVGHREVDHDVGIRFADDAERHADLADAGDQAGVFAEQRMIGRFERGDDLESADPGWPAR